MPETEIGGPEPLQVRCHRTAGLPGASLCNREGNTFPLPGDDGAGSRDRDRSQSRTGRHVERCQKLQRAVIQAVTAEHHKGMIKQRMECRRIADAVRQALTTLYQGQAARGNSRRRRKQR